jgi:hypothetical protein
MLIPACGGSPTISLPPDDAPPDVVLATYLQALRAGDCVTGRRLVVETFTLSNGDLCGSVRVIAYSINDEPARPSGDEVIFATTLTTAGGGELMPDGEHTWFYGLHRQPNGTWRLVGGGTGP